MSTASHHIRTEDLSAHIDGMLSEGDHSVIANHLATCADCRSELAQLRVIAGLLSALPHYRPRRSFQLGMEHDTHRPQPSPIIRVLPMVRSLSVAAVIVFMVAAGAFVLGGTSDDVDQATAPRSGVQSETGAADDTSQGVGQAGDARTNDERLIDRGAAASSGDDPLEDLTNLREAPQSAADQASDDVAQGDAGTASGSGFQSRFTSQYGLALVIGLGILTLLLVSLWLVLVRMSRHGRQARF